MIKLYSNIHCSFAANHLVQQLKKLGREAMIIPEWDPADESLHILYQVSNKGFLPKNYILQQTEPWCSHWFNENYVTNIIPNAIAVWDYSAVNQEHYQHQKKCIVTPGIGTIISTGSYKYETRDIDYLFYGHLDGSPRRRSILETMQNYFEIQVVTDTCGPAMWKILKRTGEVINIHYQDDSPLELYRFHEALSFGCKVWLADESRYYEHKEDNLEEIKHGLALAGV